MTTEKPVFEQIQGLLCQADNLLKAVSPNNSLHPIEADLLKDQLKLLYLSVQIATLPHGETTAAPVAKTEEATPIAKEETTVIMPTFIAADEKEEPVATETKEEPAATEVKKEEPEVQPIAATMPADDEPLFAPAEPEPEPTPTMEPMMEQIAGNPFGELFDAVEETPEEETEPAPKTKKQGAKKKEAAEEPVKNEASTNEPSLLDLLRHQGDQPQSLTLGERLSQQTDTSNAIDQRVAHNKVSDLRTVININDKFSFMTNLFHNNMKAYNDFILRLNSIERREEAMEHVRMVAKEFGWDMESATVQNFYAILERKF